MIKYVLLALMAGIVAGYIGDAEGSVLVVNLVSEHLFDAFLILLLFVMGLSFGLDKDAVATLRKTGVKLLIIPTATALGSILAGLIGGLILGVNPVASMAISAGYGWYTLTGPLIGELFGPYWGALGFATNFFREIITIIITPLAIRLDKYAPVASGGATTMDTTLPIIVRYCGTGMLTASFSSGFILTLTAPFTIIGIASLR
ncbi:MAG: lysine exporter LysO family protein [Candidatus Bathycorpusculaceae bacterium]